MLKFTVEHKHCKATKTIIGDNVWNALKNNNLDYRIWIVIDVMEEK